MFNQPFLDSLMVDLADNSIWVIGVNQIPPFYTSDNPVVKYGHAEEDGAFSFTGCLLPRNRNHISLHSKPPAAFQKS